MTAIAPGEKQVQSNEGKPKECASAGEPQRGGGDDGEPSRLTELATAVGAATQGRPRAAPVDTWHPPFSGTIDLRIAADGTWFYAGTPITRRPLVELFASILRRDPERFVLVTPAECVGISVDDAPFIAVAMARIERASGAAVEGGARLRFITNLGDEVEAGPDTPLRFESQPDGGLRPYVLVRAGLWARFTRSLAIDLLDLVSEDAEGRPGVRSGADFFPIAAAR